MRNATFRTTTAWLVLDTFRQSRASGIFYLLLVVSLMAIGVCLTLGVEGPASLAQGDEPADFLSRREPEARDTEKLKSSGVTVAEGKLTIACGAIDVPLARDTRAAVHFIELILAGGVADTLGLLLTLIWTAGFLPGFLEGRHISVLLAKPAPRWMLLVGKYVGVLTFVLFQSTVFIGGTWLAIGLRTGFWDPTYLLCIPLLLLHFSIFFSVSVLLAVCTQNAIVCVLGSLVFWAVAWSMNFGRHTLAAAGDMAAESVRSPLVTWVVDFGYWVLPKPADLGALLFGALGAGDHFGAALDPKALAAHGFSMLLAVVTSLAFAAVVLLASARKFEATDY